MSFISSDPLNQPYTNFQVNSNGEDKTRDTGKISNETTDKIQQKANSFFASITINDTILEGIPNIQTHPEDSPLSPEMLNQISIMGHKLIDEKDKEFVQKTAEEGIKNDPDHLKAEKGSRIPKEVQAFINAAKQDITKIPFNELEEGVVQALEIGAEITNPEDKTTLLLATEKLAQAYIENGNFDIAFRLRVFAAETIAPTPPLAILPILLQQEDSKLGLKLQPIDTAFFKNHTLSVQKQKYTDGSTRLNIRAKLNHVKRAELQEGLDHIKKYPQNLIDALPEGFCKGVKVSIEADTAYLGRIGPKWEGDFSSDILDGYELEKASTFLIEFEGVGKIKIGNSDEFIGEYNQLSIELVPEVSEEVAITKLPILFSILGLGTASSSSRSEDIERIKILQLFRGLYPAEAYTFEREKRTFEESIESLKNRIITQIPDMEYLFEAYLVDHPNSIYPQEVYPNQSIWSIKGLAKSTKDAGAIGLMAGVTAPNFMQAASRLVSILKHGALATQDRFELGIIAHGASVRADIQNGGAGSVFTRMITHHMSKNLGAYPLAGHLQILYDLDLVERVSYAYPEDKYGTKIPDVYGTRSSIIEFTEKIEAKEIEIQKLLNEEIEAKEIEIQKLQAEEIETKEIEKQKFLAQKIEGKKIEIQKLRAKEGSETMLNEVCIRNRVAPNFIKGIRVNNEEEKLNLIKILEQEKLITLNDLQQPYINGIPVDQFIHIGDVKAEYWA
jgi:hypothetical protein